LKQLSAYKCDTIRDYDRFKIELRKLEAEQKEGSHKPCRPATNQGAKENPEPSTSEMGQVKDLLQQLNDRIGKLEEEKAGAQSSGTGFTNLRPYPNRGARGANTRGFRGARGRGMYQAERPLAGTTFAPTCWNCNRKGHTRQNCPN